MTAARVAIIGDIAAHSQSLSEELIVLGCEPDTGEIPDDLTVVQVGDLIHKGPDTPGVIDIVTRAFDANAGRWVQLAGNHEAHHLGGPQFWVELPFSPLVEHRLQTWWKTGQMGLAAAVHSNEYGPLLVTHAGLEASWWDSIGQPNDVDEAAEALNGLRRNRAFAAGRMLQGYTGPGGVVWAEAGGELLNSWIHRRAPFGQVYGHSSPYWWSKQMWSASTPIIAREGAILDTKKRHSILQVGGRPFIGVDPGFGRWAGPNFAAFVVTGTVGTRPVRLETGAMPGR